MALVDCACVQAGVSMQLDSGSKYHSMSTLFVKWPRRLLSQDAPITTAHNLELPWQANLARRNRSTGVKSSFSSCRSFTLSALGHPINVISVKVSLSFTLHDRNASARSRKTVRDCRLESVSTTSIVPHHRNTILSRNLLLLCLFRTCSFATIWPFGSPVVYRAVSAVQHAVVISAIYTSLTL